ncbi:MAG: GAF domain-containing protein [Thermodesulfobacteriota bacterium]
MSGRSELIQVFQRVTRLIAMDLNHQQVMEDIAATLPELLDVDAVTIRLLDSSTNSFVLGASHGLSLEYLSRPEIDTSETMGMIKAGHPVASSVSENELLPESEGARQEGIQSILSLPILFQGSIIGIMRLLTKSDHTFTDDEIALSMTLAEQAGIAISNTRMINEMENQIDFMKEIQELSRLVNSTLDLDKILTTIVERLPVTLCHKGCTIRLIQPENNQLELVAAHGLSEEFRKRYGVVKDHECGLLLPDEPYAVYDIKNDPRVHFRNELVDEGICSMLAVPLKVDSEVIGVLRIFSEEQHCFTSSEFNFAVTAAEACGTAIQNGATYRKINQLFGQIEENERFLADILDCLRAQLLVIDRSRLVILVNQTFLRATGQREEEILGRKYQARKWAEQATDISSPLEEVMDNGLPLTVVHQLGDEECCQWFEQTFSPMVGADGTVEYVIEITRDITMQREFEEEQMMRVKLEGVIEMAGTVAHEINTPLFAALGTAQLLCDDSRDPETRDDLDIIIKNLKNISKLTGKMTAMTGFESRSYVGGTSIIDMT